MSRSVCDTGNEDQCPHCGVKIFIKFVELNGYCPACGKPLAVEGTITGSQFYIPEPALVVSPPQPGD